MDDKEGFSRPGKINSGFQHRIIMTKFTIKVPASSANLGPGFDVIGEWLIDAVSVISLRSLLSVFVSQRLLFLCSGPNRKMDTAKQVLLNLILQVLMLWWFFL